MVLVSQDTGCSASVARLEAAPMNDNLDTMRKRLLWRATHRGIKEMDIIIGGFAQENLASMDEPTLLNFANILEIPDQELLSWMTKQEAVPDSRKSELLLAILAFHPDLRA
jgi:antitoxin CptB